MTTNEMHGHTTVTVDKQATPRVNAFLKNNQTLIGVVLVGVGFFFANRSMLRTELQKINFSAEFWPDDFIDGEFVSDFVE